MLRKHCTNCLTVKPVAEFNFDAVQADGYQSWCAVCTTGYYRSLRAEYGRLNDARRALNAELSGDKECHKCGRTLDMQTMFSRDRTRRDGRSDWCKECDNARRAVRYDGYRARNLARRQLNS